MEALSANFLIKDSPIPVSVLDYDMRFICFSDMWIKEFNLPAKDIIGKSFYDIMPNTPLELKKAHQECLNGIPNTNEGQKFIRADGSVLWLKWRLNCWKDTEGTIGGLTMIAEDITEEKRKEDLLLKAKRVARIGGWEVDLITNEVYWTDITRAIHQVGKDYKPNLEEGINFYKAGEDREKITQIVSEAIRNGKPWDTELRIITAKGKELWVRTMGEVEIIDNTCVRIFGTFQDIDAKKRMALKYQKANNRLKIATEAARVGIWEYDIANDSLIWDSNMYKLYGINKDDFAQEYQAWKACVHPDDQDRCQQEINMAIAGKKEFKTEFRVVWPNNEIRHIQADSIVERNQNGKPLRMTGTNWDITELKNAKLQLIKSEESLQGAFESSSIGMAMVNLDGKWIKVNDSFCSSIGYTQKELNRLTCKDITFPEDLEKDLKLLQELIDGKRDSYQMEKRYYHKKGHLVYVLLTVTAVKDIKGGISHFIAQIADISSRIEAEKRLTTLVDVTSEQNNSLMNFAHIVSHNLRSHSSNLSMLSGFLQHENNEEERQNLVNMVKDASDSLNETVLHLNEVVQVKASASEKMKNIDFHLTLNDVEKNINVLLKEKEAMFINRIPKNLKIRAIPAYLDSILLNLFTNALKYSSPERTPVIKMSSQEKEGYIVVTFKDNGLGIDLKKHGNKLFGMYKTFHKNKDAKGIGLFITKNQIEAMNGKIEVESTVDVGTTFKLYFEKI